MAMFKTHKETVDSPFGILCLEASKKGISKITFVPNHLPASSSNEHVEKAKNQLQEYFEGNRKNFDLEFDLEGATKFNLTVWEALCEIPYGKTISYKELAIRIGDIKAVRAVGTANGRNNIAICIPCHRVIGSNGSLTGYAHGLEIKEGLLRLENPKKFPLQTLLSFS